MTMKSARHQMPATAGRITARDGETVSQGISDEARYTRHDKENAGQALLSQALARENMQRAWKRVKANKGAAGVDGMDIIQTGHFLTTAWPTIRQQLMTGTYRPSPVRRVGIPKADGSERELGIPTVVDRLIQQALLQVLQPLIDPTFSEHSHGFRPGRRARDAVLAAQRHVQDGYCVVVDVDLEKFFDRVNHDVLMSRLGNRVEDAGVIRLIRSCLNAGIMNHGVVTEREQGTPQGGPHILGWKAYFGLAQTPRIWRELDEWLRHRLRAIQLKQWRRGTTIYRELLSLGASAKVAQIVAANSRRWWRNSRMALNSVLTIAYFDRLGVPRLS